MSEWIVAEGIDLDKDEINVSIKYTDYGGQQYVTVKKVDMEKLLGMDKSKEENKRLKEALGKCEWIASYTKKSTKGYDMKSKKMLQIQAIVYDVLKKKP